MCAATLVYICFSYMFHSYLLVYILFILIIQPFLLTYVLVACFIDIYIGIYIIFVACTASLVQLFFSYMFDSYLY